MSTITNGANRVSGLISGLDTEELVKAMTAHTKTRINSQKQKLQTLQWKQESYRGVISKISDFKNKYLDILSESSIKANAVMKKTTATSSNEKVITASANSGAAAAKYTISQAKAAKTASFTSEGSVASGEINLDFSRNVSGRSYTVEMTLDGTTKKITYTGGSSVEESKANFAAAANAVFSEVKGSNQGFEFKNGSALSFNGGADGIFHTFSVGYNVEAVGLSSTAHSRISTSSTLGTVGFAKTLKSDDGKYNININGVDFEFDNNTKISDMISEINKSDAGVKLSFSNVSQAFTLETKETGASAEINVYQTNGNLLNSLFNWSDDKAAATNADKVNITYEAFGSQTVTPSSIITDKLERGFDPDGTDGKYSLKFIDNDGKEYTLNLDLAAELAEKADGEDSYTAEQITGAFNTAFRKAYYTATGNSYAYSNGDQRPDIFLYQSNASTGVKTLTVASSDVGVDFGDTTGFKGLHNIAELPAGPEYKIAPKFDEMTFKVNGEDVTVKASEGVTGISIQNLIDVGVFKMATNGNLMAAGDIEGVDANSLDFLNEYFGKTTLVGAKEGAIQTVYGSNSTITISSDGQNFMTYSSASSQFTFDGTIINISDMADFDAAGVSDDYITVDTAKDTSGIKEVITNFVNDYNKLLDELYSETQTTRPKSSGSYYDPLTEEQEEEMSDKEIEKWNENAKKGLLFRDSNVQKFLSDIRSAMTTRVNGFGLSDMGINLTKAWEDNGKLEINEAKLDAAIEAHGDEIAEFFTSENGLAAKLEKTVDKAVSTKAKNYGYLSALAGVEGTTSARNNQIFKQIEYIQKVIERLNDKYENEQERYWKKYTALESYMAQAQSQMSYFTEG